MTQACLQLPDFIMVVPWCHHYVLAISFDAWRTESKGSSICSWLPVSMSFSSALPHLGLAFWLVLANGTIAYMTRSKDLESACALGLVLLVLLESCHQAQASLLEDETPCGKKVVVSQSLVSLAAGYSYMCESQPRSTRVARVSRTSQFSPI